MRCVRAGETPCCHVEVVGAMLSFAYLANINTEMQRGISRQRSWAVSTPQTPVSQTIKLNNNNNKRFKDREEKSVEKIWMNCCEPDLLAGSAAPPLYPFFFFVVVDKTAVEHTCVSSGAQVWSGFLRIKRSQAEPF